jgi:ATP-binding cassette subfamily B protein
VLEDGHITEQGTHQQLVAQNGYYNYLYNLQQQKENALNNSAGTN